jgi:DNA-binding response OmpR family regulator
MEPNKIRVLLVEDDRGDAFYVEEMFSQQKERPIEIIWMQTVSSALGRLAQGDIDLILLDLSLPDSPGYNTFQSVHSYAPGVPIVVLTGLNDSETALRTVSEGAQDYVVKGDFDGRLLSRTISFAIERQKLMIKLKEAHTQINQLTKLIPICCNCKKIRQDSGYWQAIESYITEQSGAMVSHGICPDCMRSLYPEVADEILGKLNGEKEK